MERQYLIVDVLNNGAYSKPQTFTNSKRLHELIEKADERMRENINIKCSRIFVLNSDSFLLERKNRFIEP